MNDFPWLTLLVAIPLLGALVTAFVSDRALAKKVGLGFGVLTFAFAVVMALFSGFTAGEGMQLTETHAWIPAFGANWALGIDGLSMLLVLMTVSLVPLVMLASWQDAELGRPRAFFAWTLLLMAAALLVFTATDVFLFYVIFEFSLIPAYFLISGFGGPRRTRAATKFLLFQLAGGLVMLAAVVGLYAAAAGAGAPSFLISDLATLDLDPGVEKWLFIGFFFAFAVKAPLFPVHTWLADTTEQATPPTSILLVCVLDKIGTYGMIRLCLGIFPEASQWATPVVITLALISIIYGAFLAIGQDNVLRLVGLTSLSHFGFIVLGIFVFNDNGLSGAAIYMVNHGLATAALFLVAGHLVKRTGTASISQMRGLEKRAPMLAGAFLIAGLAACSLPGLAPFVSEILVIIGAFEYHWLVGTISVLAIVLAAIYALWVYQRVFTGAGAGGEAAVPATMTDLDRKEIGVLAPLLVALVVFGFWTTPLLATVQDTVEETLSQFPGSPVVQLDTAVAEGDAK